MQKFLDVSIPKHCRLWAPCNLASFGFLSSSKFTVPCLSSFSYEAHLSLTYIAIDSLESPTCVRIRVKVWKTDPFRKGCFIHIGKGLYPQFGSRLAYLAVRRNKKGPVILFQGVPPLSRAALLEWSDGGAS